MRRTILVIGAGGDVGFEVAQELSKRHSVIGTVREQAQCAELHRRGPGLDAVAQLDLSDREGLAARLDAILEPVQDLAAVIVCAAMCPNGPLESARPEVLRETLEVNTVSHLTIFQRCMPALRRARGRIIFTSSYSGQVGMPFTGVYVASKFALEGLADVMRREVAKWGVKVILVEPGGMKTKMVTRQMAELEARTATLGDTERELYGDRYRQFAKLMATFYPTSTPAGVAAQVVIKALKAKKPKARYPAGADAKQFLALNARHSDQYMDAVCLNVFESVDAATQE